MSNNAKPNVKNKKKEEGGGKGSEELIDRNVLEGFDLETKLRKTIYDILQPVGEKQAEVQKRVMEM